MKDEKSKEELTTAMHSEFQVSDDLDIRHRCINFWNFQRADLADAKHFEYLLWSCGVTNEQALKNKDFCFSLRSEQG